MELKDIVKYVAAIGGSLVTYLFGGWPALIQILVAFVVIDYVTGVLAAAIGGKLNSNIGLKGIAKKIFIFIIVACGHLVDNAMGTQDIVRDAAIYFYIANELLSILENAGNVGLPVPDILKNSIDTLKGKEKDTPG